MSRIDDALKRLEGAPKPTAGEGSPQAPFVSAWPAVSTTPNRRPPGVSVGSEPERWGADSRSATVAPVGFSSKWRERLAIGPDGDAGLVEQFRRLAATLHHAHQTNDLRSVMVTSATPGDGKTLTAVNLALVLAESYNYRVLLIDADLRRPSIPNVVDLGAGSGLSEALRSATEQKLALVPLTTRLTLLPAGQPISNSIEALTSPRMRLILDEASTRFDWVVLDAPPVGPTTDARLLSQMVGGVLFVIHAGQTQCPDVVKAIDGIGREQVLGVVLNGVEARAPEQYYYADTLGA